MEKKVSDLTIDQFQILVTQTVHKAFEELSEDILALSSDSYVKSIEEARQDYKEGRVKSFEEAFDV